MGSRLPLWRSPAWEARSAFSADLEYPASIVQADAQMLAFSDTSIIVGAVAFAALVRAAGVEQRLLLQE